MTLEEYKALEARRARGRRWFFILCAVALAVLTLCLATCSPSLVRIDSPAQNFRSAPVYQAPGKAPAPVPPSISDAQLQQWLDGVTGRNTP